jgi:HPr kinase/phosphorylase
MQHDVVTVEKFFEEHQKFLGLTKLVGGESSMKRLIREPTVNRPGLALAGFTKYFAGRRIQVIGSAEATFLKSLTPEQQEQRYKQLFSFRIPCVIYCRGINPDKMFLKAAEAADTPVFKCPSITMKFINLATLALEMMFAPHGTEMGSMVDILGVGVIVRGESGIGKSESVLELIERGYSLVSDDITKVTLVDGREIIGTSPPLTRNHMEVRGIGIINVAAMFGVKSIRTEKRVDLIVTLKPWQQLANIDRLGMDDEFVQVLGINVPHATIPVAPGRNIARLIEVAALQTKLKIIGYNAAKELNERLIQKMTGGGIA